MLKDCFKLQQSFILFSFCFICCIIAIIATETKNTTTFYNSNDVHLLEHRESHQVLEVLHILETQLKDIILSKRYHLLNQTDAIESRLTDVDQESEDLSRELRRINTRLQELSGAKEELQQEQIIFQQKWDEFLRSEEKMQQQLELIKRIRHLISAKKSWTNQECDEFQECHHGHVCQHNVCKRVTGSPCDTSIECANGGSCESGLCSFPSSCDKILQSNPSLPSGVYPILYNDEPSGALDVWCEMKQDGGWIVFQRRSDGEVDFFREWSDYVEGFGSKDGEYWLGLEALHVLTLRDSREMRVEMTYKGTNYTATYSNFHIESAESLYRLQFSGYQGNAGDSLSLHRGHQFSTKDKGPSNGCAERFKGAWWYDSCHHSNLNGIYHNGSHSSYADGINWRALGGYYYSFPFVQMMLK